MIDPPKPYFREPNILFSLIKAFLLILRRGFLNRLLTLETDAKELSEPSDIIELGKGGLPVTLKGVEYL